MILKVKHRDAQEARRIKAALSKWIEGQKIKILNNYITVEIIEHQIIKRKPSTNGHSNNL